MEKPVQYGGQALIEGVMMRGPRAIAMAVRLPNGEIEVTTQDIHPWSQKPVLKLPIIRGFVALLESLVIGTKALMFSADRAVGEEEGEELGFWAMVLTIVIAFAAGLLLFVGIPTASAHLLTDIFPGTVLQNIVEGLIRLIVLFLYILLISRLKDIQRVFQYHGAEHKAIFAHEAGVELNPENIRKYSRLHPRCGTSFLLIVVVVSIFVFAFLGVDPLWWRIVSRIILMPLVAGISYELLKLSGRFSKSMFLKWIIVPGLLLQKLTTREPDDSQLEVAIAALNGVLATGQELS
ncbi:MAG: DUF1385 domain-containing protein [Dehalobacter sp. 4CP]|jgi:uncharacterized protein YqhQ|uniref:DUF1385 domain-containing protein n=1 Tax=unclassified Dehalobacter TaxID=2635733 RepID=UPI00028BA734|nr:MULTISPECIES: DUF1385 domain-containing protein [unclassified Dehalobacter]MCM1565917.1 DUF1385 domain-containing protein [Dehalobacter sp.]NBJ15854.1 DUF1385 domain-containing protein [Dehalobacter sp. 4CP]AFV03921.1 hypothetical protein DHBDCA_p2894 [Dehalobacter sp. DCA]AFV06900.1 hypothetical protein DCF50_p2897 [Dehalobacter sp. CF]EQB19918.1 hypothetical protein UNSWDHB_2752 [Dehalobacter sp. UNSWDHB]